MIVAVGNEVLAKPSTIEDCSRRRFRVGDPLFGSVLIAPDLKQAVGALVQDVVVEMDTIAYKSFNVSFDEASCLAISGATALTSVKVARLKTGRGKNDV